MMGENLQTLDVTTIAEDNDQLKSLFLDKVRKTRFVFPTASHD
jgi:hypothetical protein